MLPRDILETMELDSWHRLGFGQLHAELTDYDRRNGVVAETSNSGGVTCPASQQSHCNSYQSHCDSMGSHCVTRNQWCKPP